MWLAIICGLVFYSFFMQILDGEDDFSDIDTSDSDASFAVAARLEKLYGGKAFVGLRIPDADTGTRQHIDVVLITKCMICSSRLKLLCIPRDYHSEDGLSDECMEIAVEPSTEVLFQPLNSNKVKKLKLWSIVRATLSG
ncbi:hypothetical protein B296_00044463 [Ensete ventricosum]|uniref:Uncharacterized protein n=1 Tax=Ensete ventricosum TaxID=4639 RepID=A0A426ZAW7_ENSVE|nr:hypothetical protein B296_00044463 [Ensete ventricosum]